MKHAPATPHPASPRPWHAHQPDGPDKTPTDDVTTSDQPPGIFKRLFSYRYLMVLLLHGSMIVSAVQRDSMSMVIVCMFDDEDGNATSSSSSFPSSSSSSSSSSSLFPSTNDTNGSSLMTTDPTAEPRSNRPDWDVQTRGLIISAGTFPCCLSPILGEFLRKRVGNKTAMTLILGTGCVLTFLGPVISRTDPYLTIASRVLQGLCYGGHVPIVGDCIAWWAPQGEKLVMTSIVFTGLNMASIIIFLTSGFLCSISLLGGWPFIFYTNGAISVVWLVLWLTLSSHKPEEHPLISLKEKEYIAKHRVGLGGVNVAGGKTPYMKILKSPPVVALVYGLTAHMWGLTLLMTFSPIYLKDVLKFTVQQIGLIMTAITTVRFFSVFVWVCLGNWLTTKTSVTKSRKISVALGFFPSGLAVASLAFVQEHSRWAVVGILAFIFTLQMSGAIIFTVVPVDLAPRYAGFISATWFFTGTLVAVSAPLSATVITSDDTLESWRTMWYIAASVAISIVVIFTIFGQAKLQPWARDDIDIDVSPDASSDTRPGVKSGKNGDANQMTGIDNPRFELESSYDMPAVGVEGESLNRPDASTNGVWTTAPFHPARPAFGSVRPENIAKGGSVLRTRL